MPNKSLWSICIGLLLAAAAAFGQTPAAGPGFDVATVKPAAPLNPAMVTSGQMHVGMKIDAARVDIGFMSLSDLLCIAYRVKPYQLSGPDWMGAKRWDILATLPEGANKDQVPEMLQALLAERFQLTVHRESKEHSVYALLVGKNGPKLKESVPEPDEPPSAEGATGAGNGQVRFSGNLEGKGMVIRNGQNGSTRMSMGPGGSMHLETSKMTMEALADVLSRFLDRPVVDQTELKGNYQVALDLSMEDLRNVARKMGVASAGAGPATAAAPTAPAGDASRPADAASDPSGGSIFSNVQQLGLKLEPRKAPVALIVVDKLEKTPTEN